MMIWAFGGMLIFRGDQLPVILSHPSKQQTIDLAISNHSTLVGLTTLVYPVHVK